VKKDIKLTEEQIDAKIMNIAASHAIEGIELTEDDKKNMLKVLSGEAHAADVVAKILKEQMPCDATA